MLACALLAVAGHASAQTLADVTYVGLQTGDAVTTHLARARGARELNPLGRGPLWLDDGIKAVQTVGVLWLLHRLSGGHPRAARVLEWSINAGMGVVVGSNLRQLATIRRATQERNREIDQETR